MNLKALTGLSLRISFHVERIRDEKECTGQ